MSQKSGKSKDGAGTTFSLRKGYSSQQSSKSSSSGRMNVELPKHRNSVQKRPTTSTNDKDLLNLVGMQEVGEDQKYSSVAKEEGNDSIRGGRPSNVVGSLPNSPMKPRSEVGGTGNNDEPTLTSSAFHISRADKEDEASFCEKKNCHLRAFGKCQWRNPCSLPRRSGGCQKLYCELHGADFKNFRRFQCCQDCYSEFMSSRKCRQKARLALFILIGAFIGLTAVIVATSLFGQVEDGGEVELTLAEKERQKVVRIFEGELAMSSEDSEYWGKLALEEANKARRQMGLDELEWSEPLHTIAHRRNEEVAKGIISNSSSKFMDLLIEARSFYLPDYQVQSMSEQISQIDNAQATQDFISLWRQAWNVDHLQDVRGSFNYSSTAVYFVTETQEVLFTQLFAQITELAPI